MLPVIERINVEISDFQAVYDLLLQVKDESFKTQHWHVSSAAFIHSPRQCS